MRPRVYIVGDDLGLEVALTLAVGLSSYDIDLIEADRPLRSLLERPAPAAAAAIVMLDRADDAADLRDLLAAHPTTRFVFLMRDFPPAPVVERILDERASVVLPADESPVVVAATLVAMLAAVPSSASA